MPTWRALTSARTGETVWVNLDQVQTMRVDGDEQTRLWFGGDDDGGMLVEECIESILD